MTKQLQTKKEVNRLALLFALTYMISYVTRINYGAIVSEMELATQISKSQLSMALTGSFITYGIGQIISGICGDRFSPKKLVFWGLITTTIMNLLLPLCKSAPWMVAVWCVNGFAQSLMWPPLVRLMSALLSAPDYNRVVVRVSWGSSFGTILVYLCSPLLISLCGWRTVFFTSAACGAIMALIWNRYSYEIEPEQKRQESPQKRDHSPLFSPFMICIMATIALQGMLRDGITTWMPSFVSETYHISNVISILTGVALPIFGILCLQITSRLYSGIFFNPLLCAGTVFGTGAVAALGLFLLYGKSAVVSILLSAILTGCMHGVNLMQVSMLPPYFKKYGNVSTVSGVLNFCTYIGSAASTWSTAVISENLGWHSTLLVWLLVALAGTVLCLLCATPWQKRMRV